VLAVCFGHLACGQTAHEAPPEAGSGGQALGDAAGGHVVGDGDGDGGTSSGSGGRSGGSTGGRDGGASGGQGTGGVPTLCPAIPAVCVPGVEGCSDRGETYLCTECGQMELQGQDCARLITSDKEAGFICIIRAEDELICVGAAAEWSEELTFPMQLPGFAVQLRLPDDSTHATQDLAYCFIDDAGAIHCVDASTQGALTAPSGSDCTDLSITDGPAVCGLCAGTLTCAGNLGSLSLDELNVADAQAIGLSDTTQLIWLDSAGEIHGRFEEEVHLSGTYTSFFLDDDARVCGIEPDGDLVCAVGDASATVEVPGPFLRGSAGSNDLRCAVTVSGAVSCFAISDAHLTPSFSPEGSVFMDVAVSMDRACALTQRGSVVCWDREGLLDEWTERMNP